jgi:class 3 adenylate cyclase
MLNAAFGASVPIVLEEGGTVVQFMGDAMMVLFNAPSLTTLDGQPEPL